jgi:hypothetical protein
MCEHEPHLGFWKRLAADWKPALSLAVPIFAPAMWFGISRGYADIALYAFVMALGALHLAEMVVVFCRMLRDWLGGDA